MRILFLIRALNYAGAERQLVALARGLRELGHSVAVVVFYGRGPLENELREAGVEVLCLNKSGRWDVVAFLWRLIETVRQFQPDILHGYLCVSNILSVVLALMFPRVRVVCGVRASNMDLSKYDWLHRVLYHIECHLSRFADLIIANSQSGGDYAVANGFPRDKMIVIPNGIDTELFRPDKERGLRVRTGWGITENQKLIGIVARLDPMKDHATFLKAAALLAKEKEEVAFVSVGDGREEYKRLLVEMTDELGLTEQMFWIGARDDMPDVYNALDVVVSSSSFGEGFSNVIGEAMACGVPCVVTDVGDSAMIVSDLGEVILPKSPEALKVAIEKVLMKVAAEDYARELNRRPIVNRYSVVQLVNTTEAAFSRLCEGTGTA